MLCLAFDTSTLQSRFALAAEGELLAYQPYNASGRFTDALLPIMSELIAASGRRLEDVDLIALTRGPGSFTGVRVGVATAKALAYARDVPLIAVSSLEAMAAAMLQEQCERDWAVPVIDARRGEVYTGVFRRRGCWVEVVASPSAAPPDQWWRRILNMIPDPEAPVYAGSGTLLLLGQGEGLRDELRSVGEPVLRPWKLNHPATARALALIASRGDLDPFRIDPFALTPLYLRASDAEVQRGLDLTPQAASEGLALLEDRRPKREDSP